MSNLIEVEFYVSTTKDGGCSTCCQTTEEPNAGLGEELPGPLGDEIVFAIVKIKAIDVPDIEYDDIESALQSLPALIADKIVPD